MVVDTSRSAAEAVAHAEARVPPLRKRAEQTQFAVNASIKAADALKRDEASATASATLGRRVAVVSSAANAAADNAAARVRRLLRRSLVAKRAALHGARVAASARANCEGRRSLPKAAALLAAAAEALEALAR